MRRSVAVLFVVLMAVLAGLAGPAVATASDVRVHEGTIDGAECDQRLAGVRSST